MSFHELDGLRYYGFEIFSETITQAVFTRRGGISPAPWSSLNLGGSVGDDPAHVAENRARLFNAMGRRADSIHDVWLIHGTDIVYADVPRPLSEPSPRADIIFTDNPDVTLFMRFGDCVPILFHDPIKNVIGIAHAGWLGTLRGVVGAAVEGMKSHYGCDPKNIIAGVGPSIGADHYQVGADVISQFAEKFPQDINQITQTRDGGAYLDLWESNALQLKNAGVEQIQVSGVCTACNLDDWFSHRAEKGKTGRFGALMALNG
ncbi:MAG: peptidoglycan editing factor PgeF [Anaerolineales bacterium]|nr:peptidoglycan editing factor PgeF [Anaerolineales bacterium]